MTAPPPLPVLNFRTTGLPDAAAFAHWREVMAPLFQIQQARYSSALPRGNITVFVVGDIMINRCTFNAQHLTRDPAMIAATPNHLVLQYYRAGGFRGTIAGQQVSIMRGQVAVCDLSQEVDAYAATSDTIGMSVPRSLLGGIDPAALCLQLDSPCNRLLGGFMADLPKRLAKMSQSDVPHVTAETVAILARIFSSAGFGDNTAQTSDETLLESALKLIDKSLGEANMSPAVLAVQLGVSRGTLYRLFAPMGGVMRYVIEKRLVAVRDVLNDPLDKRNLAQLSIDHGFTSQALLSRGFRARFGTSPRAWRQEQVRQDLLTREQTPNVAFRYWDKLGN